MPGTDLPSITTREAKLIINSFSGPAVMVCPPIARVLYNMLWIGREIDISATPPRFEFLKKSIYVTDVPEHCEYCPKAKYSLHEIAPDPTKAELEIILTREMLNKALQYLPYHRIDIHRPLAVQMVRWTTNRPITQGKFTEFDLADKHWYIVDIASDCQLTPVLAHIYGNNPRPETDGSSKEVDWCGTRPVVLSEPSTPMTWEEQQQSMAEEAEEISKLQANAQEKMNASLPAEAKRIPLGQLIISAAEGCEKHAETLLARAAGLRALSRMTGFGDLSEEVLRTMLTQVNLLD